MLPRFLQVCYDFFILGPHDIETITLPELFLEIAVADRSIVTDTTFFFSEQSCSRKLSSFGFSASYKFARGSGVDSASPELGH